VALYAANIEFISKITLVALMSISDFSASFFAGKSTVSWKLEVSSEIRQ
jgi:hypothetical protein